MGVPDQPPRKSRWSVSLRTLLLLFTAAFVIGYQQFQIRQIKTELNELAEQQADQRAPVLKWVQTPPANTPVRVLIKPTPAPGTQVRPGQLLFPIEVEEAMMGDSLRVPPPLVPSFPNSQ